MTNEKDREYARVLLGRLSDLFENAFDATDDHAFDSPEEEMIDAIVEFCAEAVKAEREELRAQVETLREALGKYGKHTIKCASSACTIAPCNCGFSKALAATEPKQ